MQMYKDDNFIQLSYTDYFPDRYKTEYGNAFVAE